MGWFAAKVRFRAVRAGRTKDDLFEDSVFVFRSRSSPVALRRAESIAQAMVQERTETDDKGRKVRWELDCIHDVVEVGSEGLVDGTEIWRDRLVRRKGTG